MRPCVTSASFPDNTNFSFIRFRRFSFPISAVLSILSLVFFFTHGLNYGIDFKGGTLLEVKAPGGKAEMRHAAHRRWRASASARCSCRRSARNGEVMIRIAQQPGGDAAQQAAAQKVRDTLGTELHL